MPQQQTEEMEEVEEAVKLLLNLPEKTYKGLVKRVAERLMKKKLAALPLPQLHEVREDVEAEIPSSKGKVFLATKDIIPLKGFNYLLPISPFSSLSGVSKFLEALIPPAEAQSFKKQGLAYEIKVVFVYYLPEQEEKTESSQ